MASLDDRQLRLGVAMMAADRRSGLDQAGRWRALRAAQAVAPIPDEWQEPVRLYLAARAQRREVPRGAQEG
jgi:hypothetical protein